MRKFALFSTFTVRRPTKSGGTTSPLGCIRLYISGHPHQKKHFFVAYNMSYGTEKMEFMLALMRWTVDWMLLGENCCVFYARRSCYVDLCVINA